jgi:molybdopterin converting factor subunit 1
VRINVLYFGILKDVFGTASEVVELVEASDVAVLYHHLRARTSNEAEVWSSLAVAVNRQYATSSTVLYEGDEVALLPPVSGGSVGSNPILLPPVACMIASRKVGA